MTSTLITINGVNRYLSAAQECGRLASLASRLNRDCGLDPSEPLRTAVRIALQAYAAPR